VTSNGKHRNNRHSNVLKVSGPAIVGLGNAVTSRFLDLCGTYLRVNGVELDIPKYLDVDMFLWRTMSLRHRKGDYRNTDDEKKSVRRIADWTLQENCKLKGQEYVPLDWGDF